MAPRSSTRAVVVDDSHFMRSVISDILTEGGIEVVAQARDGAQAIEAVREHDPDVVTMDVEMPGMDGIEAVERIMTERPTPILMLSAHTDADAEVTFRALEKGAVDCFPKPGGEVSMEMSRLKDKLVEMVLSVAAVDPTAASPTAPEADGDGQTAAATGQTEDTPSATYPDRSTVIIGSSTGGPTVVEQVLSELPPEAGLRVLIVQHMPEGFTGRFAGRLDERSEYDVREATDGARIAGGEALVAAGSAHLEVAGHARGNLHVALSTDPPVNSVRPAVDVTMQSAAEVLEDPVVGVVLTGMGTDGAAGVEALDRVGGRIVAQDEASSAVFGMPRRAIETGCVDTVEPVETIPDAILRLLEQEEA
jgi:two-component system chemotaxis response regulator CheB